MEILEDGRDLRYKNILNKENLSSRELEEYMLSDEEVKNV